MKPPAKTPKTVLFLCTGNFYRSRFAEIYFNFLAEKHALGWRAASRGLAVELTLGNIGRISLHVVEALAERGIPLDPDERYPQSVRADDLRAANRIIALKEAEHRPLLVRQFPEWLERVEFWHVHDLDCAPAEDALAHLEKELWNLLSRLRTPA